MKVYVVTAHSVYQGNQHSYVVGVYDNLEDSEGAIIIEETNRGGKYECRIQEFTLGELPEEMNGKSTE
jgi:hypothetical protein